MNELRRPNAAPRRKRRGAFARVLSSLLTLVALVALGGVALGVYGMTKIGSPGPLAADTVFEVKRGLGTREIGKALENAGIVSSGGLFSAAAMVTGKRASLKPGEYQFRAGMSMDEVLDLLASGRVITYKLSVPEGWTTAQALDRIRENGVLIGDISVAAEEGLLLPDTYVFTRGETRDNLLRGMIKARQKLVDELWAQRDPDVPVKTPEEAMILASIVEKETGVAEERPRVASVFVNRLKAGMRLQSDPTTIYGITLGKSKLDRPLTRQDIATKTPYNTYQIYGLPPGPIANPGRDAIAATLNPAKTRDLYFVADGSGGHAFAETLDEHNKNVAKWREIEKQRREAAGLAPVEDLAAPEQPAAGEQPADAEEAAETETGVADNAGAQNAGEQGLTEPAEDAPAGQVAASGIPPEDAATDLSGLPLPEPTNDAPEPPGEMAAADNQAKVVPVPKPKPEKHAGQDDEAAGEPEEVRVANLKPGSVIRVGKRLLAIPMPKPDR